MDLSTFKERYGGLVDMLEEFAEETHSTVAELMSPAYFHNTLPNFVKRLKYKLNLIKTSPRQLEKSLQENKAAMQESYRIRQFTDAVTGLRRKLGTIQAQINDFNAGSAVVLEEDDEQQASGEPNKTLLIGFPPTAPLEEAKARHLGNKIISTRLDKAVSTCGTILNNCRETWMRENLLRQSTEGVQQVLSETLLSTFDREVHDVAIAMRTFYDRKINAQIAQFEAFCRHQRQCALDQQHAFYRDMYRRVKEQHAIFGEMMALLSQQAAALPHKERMRLEARIRELHKRQRSLFVEAEIYYEQSHETFVFQPLSSLFFRTIKRWLVQYQTLLAEQLLQLQKVSRTDKSKPANPAEATPLESSALYQFAQKQLQLGGASKLLDKSGALVEPRSETVGGLLSSFMAFHMQSNRSNLERLQREIRTLEQSWQTLSQEVARAHQLQQRWYSLRDGQLPDVKLVASAASPKADAGATPPEGIKMLLHLDGELKALEVKLKNTHERLFNRAQPDFLRTQEQTAQVAHILEYLKQWQRLSVEWEDSIRQESVFVQGWKDISRANHRYVAMQFIDFNFFVTGQLDNMLSSCNLFASNIFHRMRELHTSFLSQLVDLHQQRQTDLDLEMSLLGNLHEDLRREDFAVADSVVRLQTQIHDWYQKNKHKQLVQHQSTLKNCLLYHVAGLDALLRKLQEPIANPLVEFLAALDTMYENAIKCEETSDEQAALLSKEQFLIDKLQRNGTVRDD